MRADPVLSQSNIGACPKAGSYFYARLTREAPYGVVAARMERQATGANYSGNLLIPSPANIDPMIQARPLDPSSDDADKIFLLISN